MKPGLARLPLFTLMMILLAVFGTACSKEKSFEKGTANGSLRIREYPLNDINSSGMNGTISIAENPDSSVTIMVTLNKSMKDLTHVLHLHNGSPESPGTIAITLASVKGTGDRVQSITNNITEAVMEDGMIREVTYDDFITMEGFVDVHQSITEQDIILAQGRIGI
jgi:hypothetical protein